MEEPNKYKRALMNINASGDISEDIKNRNETN
jgi:hypothetical protein